MLLDAGTGWTEVARPGITKEIWPFSCRLDGCPGARSSEEVARPGIAENACSFGCRLAGGTGIQSAGSATEAAAIQKAGRADASADAAKGPAVPWAPAVGFGNRPKLNAEPRDSPNRGVDCTPLVIGIPAARLAWGRRPVEDVGGASERPPSTLGPAAGNELGARSGPGSVSETSASL